MVLLHGLSAAEYVIEYIKARKGTIDRSVHIKRAMEQSKLLKYTFLPIRPMYLAGTANAQS